MALKLADMTAFKMRKLAAALADYMDMLIPLTAKAIAGCVIVLIASDKLFFKQLFEIAINGCFADLLTSGEKLFGYFLRRKRGSLVGFKTV